jgi:hypothetical protein
MKAVRLSTVILVAMTLCAAAALAKGSKAHYEGKLDVGQGEVELWYRPSGATVKFAVKHIPLLCDDGTTAEFTFRRFRASVQGNGRFYTDTLYA